MTEGKKWFSSVSLEDDGNNHWAPVNIKFLYYMLYIKLGPSVSGALRFCPCSVPSPFLAVCALKNTSRLFAAYHSLIFRPCFHHWSYSLRSINSLCSQMVHSIYHQIPTATQIYIRTL